MDACLFQVSCRGLIATLSALFLLSSLCAIGLEHAERRYGFVSDHSWLTGVIGVAFTLTAVALLDRRAALLTLIAFAASGTPLVIRSLVNDAHSRAELRQLLAQRGHHNAGDGWQHDRAKTLAQKR
jgi:hypothetical protein